jgi:hypothetical protein
MNRLTKQVWPFAPNMTEALAKFNRYAVDLEMYRYLQNYPTDSEEAKIFASITVYYGGKIGEIIAGPPQNVESAVKALVDQIRSMGLAKLDAFHTAAYGQYMAKVKKYTP